MHTADLLDTIGGLTSRLKTYAAKLPSVVHLTAVPTGVKPQLEVIEEYEDLVSRIRMQSAGTFAKDSRRLQREGSIIPPQA